MAKSISKKQLLANRKNAKKSTGPKTKQGKLTTSKNAIQHGLDAEKFVVIGEKINDLVIFRDRLIDHLKPQGVQEEIIVSKMIDVAIRLRRIPIIEAGIFNHEMLEYEAKENKDRVAHAIEGIGDKEIIISANTIICKTGLAFARDCDQGSAILKLNTIEDRLLAKYFKLLELLKKMQKKRGLK